MLSVLLPPNPVCMVCSPKPQIVLKIDTARMTVKSFRDDVLIKALHMVNPDVMVEGKGVILISSEEGETDSNNDTILKNLSIVDGCVLNVDDFFQNYQLSIIIVHRTAERDDTALFEVIADHNLLKPDAEKDNDSDNKAGESSTKEALELKKLKLDVDDDMDDDCCFVEDDADANAASSSAACGSRNAVVEIKSPPKKRKPDEGEPLPKRSKQGDSMALCFD